MYRNLAAFLFPIVTVAGIGLGIWGYTENQDKNSILIKAENQYQNAFHDLNAHVNSLHEELGKALAVNSRQQLTPCLVNVWRLTYAAESDLGQLPLGLMPFSNTEDFLANVGDFSYRVAIRDMERDPLTEKEWHTLQSLYKNSGSIKKQLNVVQTKVIDENLRWMDVEMALASEGKQLDNTIVDGFKTVEKNVQEFSEVDWGSGANSVENRKEILYEKLKAPKVDVRTAQRSAAKFLGLKDPAELEMVENGKGLEYASYSGTLKGKGGDDVHIDVSKKGGQVIWMMNERKIGQPALSHDETLQKARSFLSRHGYENMAPVSRQPYDNTTIYTFVYQQDGVYIMPDEVTVKVALDNGEVTGFQAEPYILHHKERSIARPALSEDEIRSFVNPNLEIRFVQLALVEDDREKEVLCYQVVGEIDGEEYRISLDAQNGNEVEVEHFQKIDATRLFAVNALFNHFVV